MFMNSVSLCKKLTMTDFKEMFYTAVGSSIPEHAEIVITIKQIIKVYMLQLYIGTYKMLSFISLLLMCIFCLNCAC